MKAFGDTEAVNLSTGQRFQRVSGDGDSRLVPERELGPGECGGQSCPPEYDDVCAEHSPERWGKPEWRVGNGSGFGFDAGGGRRVIRSTKSFT